MALVKSSKRKKPAPQTDLDLFRSAIGKGHLHGNYYVALLGLRHYDPLKIYQSVKKGFPFSAFSHFQRNTDLSTDALLGLISIPARTLARRKKKGRLDPDESDRLLRASRVFGRALQLFEGDSEAAKLWMSSAQRALGGMIPVELATTDVGAKEVEQLVGRLEYGIPT